MSVYSVNVYPSSTTIRTGNWYYGAYAVVNASSNCNTGVRWYSNNTSIATVNASSGYIYAKAPGTTRIYAQSTVDSSKKDYITVTVTSGTICVNSVTLNRSSISLEKGETYTLSATICPTNATNKTISWRSTNTSVATVNCGVVTAKAGGYAYIYAEAQDGSGEYDSCYVNVTEDILVTSVTVSPSSKTMNIGNSAYLYETVCPINATNKCVKWSSNNTSVATVNPDTGLVVAQGTGTATITATAQDGSGKKGYCTITVNAPIAVTGIEVCPTSLTMNVGDIEYLCASIAPYNATNQTVSWHSSNENVATVGLYTGKVTAKKAGTVTITATTADGRYSDRCEVWVHGKTPVFLIHGRTSNSTDVWGVNNNIPSGKNDDFDSDINAEALNGKKYINVNSQEINSYEPNEGGNETPVNLGIHLQNSGYNGNLNLFVFNYPNEDAVKHSAQKFEAYINNLISYVRTSGSNEMKACFYASRSDYENENHKINIVGHSMGGLVARYYIENMGYMISYNAGDLVYYEEIGYDKHVDKLITICTPHWGSGYADLSNWTSIKHKLCDHDLDFESIMFGGNNPNNYKFDENGCKILENEWKCIDHAYELSNELQYSSSRNTRYYAIAGIDYPGGPVIQNDYCFEMSTNYTTYQQIDDFMVGKQVYRYAPSDFNSKSVGDNMVGFMSQIGWTDNIGNTPNKKIPMEKIFIDVDTNGDNGGGVFIWEVVNGLGSEIFHNKAPHRTPVCNKVIEYLED